MQGPAEDKDKRAFRRRLLKLTAGGFMAAAISRLAQAATGDAPIPRARPEDANVANGAPVPRARPEIAPDLGQNVAGVDGAPIPRSRPEDLIPADLAEWEEEGLMAPIPRVRPEAPRTVARLVEPDLDDDIGPDEGEAERLRTLINAPIPRARPALRNGTSGQRQTVAAVAPTRRTLMGLPPADLELHGENEGIQAAVLRQMPAPLVVPPGARRLRLYNVNTLETFDDVYWQDGRYVPTAMRKLRAFMRDYRANASRDMDPRLYDLLHSIAHKAGSNEPFKVISAYRSPRTNAARARRSRGVAKNSYHVKGMAIDIALPGYSLRGLQNVAMSMSAGGVGYYSRSGFVHVDVGPVRTW